MIWSDRLPNQRHMSFGRAPISLLVVTLHTSTHQVLPRVLTAASTGDHVVDGQCNIRPAAILAAVSIPPQDVLARKNDLLKGDTNVDREADDAGERNCDRDRVKEFAVVGFDQLSFSQIEKDYSFFDIAYAQGLIVMVEHKHLAIHFAVGAGCVVNRTEV